MIPVPHRIVLLGFGNVGREFVRLLLERRSELRREHGLDADRVRRVRASGGRVKQVARGARSGWRVEASVSVEELLPDHPLSSVDGTSSALRVRTDMLKDLLILERNPGARQTAYAVYSDLIAVHEGRLNP